MKGIIIGLIVLAALALLALLIGLFSRRRKSSSSSHFYDEERDERRQFTPLASQELNHDNMRSERKDYKGPLMFHFSHTEMMFLSLY